MNNSSVTLKYDVSIIIVNYKTATIIRNCIHSIESQNFGISYEIILVDNNSNDDISEITKDFKEENIKLLKLAQNIGFGKANNEGSKVAKGKYLFFLNPDTILLNNAITILCHHLESNPHVGVAGGNLYNEEKKPALSFRRIYPGIIYEIFEMTGHKLESWIYNKNWSFNHTNKKCRVAYISGADLMISKSLFERIGGFSKEFFMYCEDTDLCLKVHKTGMAVENTPLAKIQHLEGKSTRKEKGSFSEKGLYWPEQGRITYYKKNTSKMKFVMVNMIYFISLNFLFFITFILRMPSYRAFKYRRKIFTNLIWKELFTK